MRPDTGDTGETALLPGTGAKIIILPQPGKCKGSPGQPFLYLYIFLYLFCVTAVNDAFSGSRKCRKQGIKNGSKGARTLDLPLVRRALIPAELCFHTGIIAQRTNGSMDRACAGQTRLGKSGGKEMGNMENPEVSA